MRAGSGEDQIITFRRHEDDRAGIDACHNRFVDVSYGIDNEAALREVKEFETAETQRQCV